MRYRANRSSKIGRSLPSFLGAALIAFALLAFLATPAFAVETHAFTGITIGPGGKAAPGQFSDLASVTVDPSSGDLYVLDVADNGRLYKFDGAGEPLNFAATGTNFIEGTAGYNGNFPVVNQVAIAPPGAAGGTVGDIYIANDDVLKIYSPAGLEIGQITPTREVCGVATDATGNIFIKPNPDNDSPFVRRYTPTTNPPTNADESGMSTVPIQGTCNLAVDGNGHIYVSGKDGTQKELWEIQSLAAESAKLVDPNSRTVAVEAGTNDVYVSNADEFAQTAEITQYGEDGSAVIAKFGEGRLVESPGLSIAGVGGDIYVANRTVQPSPFTFSGRVDVFGPLAALPKAVAGSAGAITKTSAVLHGTIDADGGPQAECRFEYTTQATFQRRNEEQRLTVAAAGGTFTLSFAYPAGGMAQTTAPIAFNASASTVQAALRALSNIGASNVTVGGGPGDYTITFTGARAGENLEQLSVDPTNLTETGAPAAEVQTVTDGQAGGFSNAMSKPCAPSGPFTGSAAEAVSAEISGLTVGTEYRFRLVGQNENGSLGSDENGSAAGHVPSFESLPAFNVQTGPVTDLTTTSVTLTGSINPEGVSVSECFFEYGLTAAYGTSIPCEAPGPGEIGAGNAPVAVHAALAGLTASTDYHFRLVGGSGEFAGIKVRGADVPFGTLGPPEILSQAFSGVGQTTATISGSINPHSSPTTYFVEYVTEAAFEESGFVTATKVPTGGLAIGSAFTGVEVSQAPIGLSSGTRYHFRLYAENSLGHDEGPDGVFTTKVTTPTFGPCPANEVFRVEWSAALPDCRAYEQASSPDKNGDSVAGLYPMMFAAEDGSAVTFYSPAGALPPAEGGGTQIYSTYLARRDAAAGSWSSQRLLPPEELGEEAEYLGSTPDLRYAVLEAGPVEEAGLYVTDTEDGSVTQVVPKESKPGRSRAFGFDGASADGSRIFFESTTTISTTPENPAPAAGHDNLYIWERSTGEVSLVGVLPAAEGGKAPLTGSFGGAYEWYESESPSTGGALSNLGGVSLPLAVAGLHAISPSGEQIFFTSAGTGQLYLRRGLGGANPTTVHISTPNAGVSPSNEFPAAFLEATPDGSRAFFMSRQKLTVNAASGESPGENDLYRWDAAAPAEQGLTDIAPGAEVRGLLGVNFAGTAGYFIGRGVLAAKAEAGGENLYRFAEKSGGGFRITFIATLAAGSEQTPDRRNVSPSVGYTYPLGRTSRLSENGETLLFASRKSLTGYDNSNLGGTSCEAGLCPELYLYSAQTGKVTCVSCDPTGEAPSGAASLQDQFFNAYFTPNEPPAIFPSRNLAADGTKVFFQTPDPLVTGDINGDVSCPAFGGEPGNLFGPGRCQDVYEWEAVGSGSCEAAEANGGCLYLLSTGQSGQPSYFVGASKDGSSAFIATASQLVPADHDQAHDVYDVREGGGLASQQARPLAPCSSAESCKGSGSSSPPPTSPATSSFQGSGNPKPKCRKGYVAKKGKCVKRPKKHNHKPKRATGKKRSGGAK